jgi:hypothetical protein
LKETLCEQLEQTHEMLDKMNKDNWESTRRILMQSLPKKHNHDNIDHQGIAKDLQFYTELSIKLESKFSHVIFVFGSEKTDHIPFVTAKHY